MKHPSFPKGATRRDLVDWYRRGREISKQVFAIPREEAYYSRPINLRNPIVFYEGHLPAFAVNTLIKLALKENGINADYERLFERGIDPESEDAAKSPTDLWPKRGDVLAYGARADELIAHALCDADIERDDIPQRRNGEAALAILEHEQMHQETLMYMFHEMPYEQKIARAPFFPSRDVSATSDSHADQVRIPAGVATLGARDGDFAWDNELPPMRVAVDEFAIDRHNVTNGEYLDYINATDTPPPHFWTRQNGAWFWRGMFALTPLPLDAAVYVTQEEAAAFAAWRGMRLPTEAEYHRAAFSNPHDESESLYPWGDAAPDETRGNFGFTHWDPVAVGSYPAGASAWGVHDLVGNGWEWTSTPFDGFPGFVPMSSYPVYSSDFFDGKHYVMKGASPATAPQLIRSSFRNWFRGNYPYVYATFRCVSA